LCKGEDSCIDICKDVSELDVKGPTLALISGRTADNPRLLKEVIEAGCSHVYLDACGEA